MFIVQVIQQKTGKPAEGKRVSVYFDSFMRSSAEGRTDKKGEAAFDNENGNGKVKVDGKELYKGNISGRVTVFV